MLVIFTYTSSNAFVTLNAGSPAFDRDMIIWHASEIRAVQAMMQLTVLPMGIETMSQAVIDEFATFLAEINVRFDVPILLRYGHEMNGPWAEFGMKPTAYVQNFRLMADAVHERTKMTSKDLYLLFFSGRLKRMSTSDDVGA